MADRSNIEWTDSTWNPVTGCTKVSPGCDHCYAETLAERFRGTPGHYFERGFDVVLRPDKLEQPLRWKKPRRIFVNSMSDLFHDAVPDDFIARVFAVMAQAPHHTFQVLTKRHGRMRSLLGSGAFRSLLDQELGGDGARESFERDVPWPLPNVWLGVSVENQQWADIRIPALLDTPAAVRFLSMEPLLGPVDLRAAGAIVRSGWEGERNRGHLDGRVDWVIVGGESGRGARPMHPDWVRSLRDQCTAAGVPFHFKQWGAWAPSYQLRSPKAIPPGPPVRAEHLIHHPENGVIRMHLVGKKHTGRELDGRTWDEFPGTEGRADSAE